MMRGRDGSWREIEERSEQSKRSPPHLKQATKAKHNSPRTTCKDNMRKLRLYGYYNVVILILSLRRTIADSLIPRKTVTTSSSDSSIHEPPPCSLNGIPTVDGSCLCDSPWTGLECGQLKLLPVPFPQGYGMQPNLTTWGADMFIVGQHPADDGYKKTHSNSSNKYHLFVSVMTKECSLRSWRSHSRIEHAVSDNITGPFQFRDVAVPVFSHNPKIIQLKDGTLALIHIGDGDSEEDHSITCQRFDTTRKGTLVNSIKERRLLQDQTQKQKQQVTYPSTTRGSTIHVARSVQGPWAPLLNHTLGNCNNPAPFVRDENGVETIYIVCSHSNHSALMQATHITGPWTLVSNITPFHETIPESTNIAASSTSLHFEDPAFYIDQRGYHIIYHAYVRDENPPHGHDCTHSMVSAHVFSDDGKHWYKSRGQPYGTQIEILGNKTVTVSTRERPSLISRKDAEGNVLRISHLITSVCSAVNCPDGPPEGCVDCKYDNWDYTLIQPLDV